MTEDLVWRQTCDDGAYECLVLGISEYSGRLLVTEQSSGTILLDEIVSLSYGAIFGPDVGDVADWQERALVAIDAWIAGIDGP